MTKRSTEICIVGAGAAGIWAAERAARHGAEVLLLEKTPRVGTKILASGGQKCNLTTTRDARAAGRLFGDDGERFLRNALRALTPQRLRERFHRWGVQTKTAHLEKVFPKSERAVDVRDALENEARDAGVEIVCEAPVADIGRDGDRWRVAVDGDLVVDCEKLMVTPGGKSYPGAGTTGDGYRWMRDLGFEIVEPVPHLVGLHSPEPWIEELAGVDLPGVEARMVDADGRILGRRRRPVVFTHEGISGPGAMDLAKFLTRPLAERGNDAEVVRYLELDLYPDTGHETLHEAIIEAAERPGAVGVHTALPDGAPQSVFRVAARMVDLPEKGLMVDDLPKKKRNQLVDRLKRFPLRVTDSRGFAHAEVTDGGVAVDQIDPKTMRAREFDDLYVFGEILDVAGPIGGLNFQAAWSEAELAGTDAGS